MSEEVEDPQAEPVRRTSDPDDDFLVALADSAEVEALISGDQHLLEFEGAIPVVTPGDFLRRLGA